MNLRELRGRICYETGLAKHLFIHIPKNAGVSLRKAPQLQNRIIGADPHYHISREYTRELAETMKRKGEHHGFQHARYRDIHPKVRAKLKTFAVVRNPWSRVVSRYRFALTAIESGKAVSDYISPSFEEFLEERHRYGQEPFYWHRAIRGWYPQRDYLVDEEGEVKVDVLSFENMDEDLKRYFGLAEPIPRRNVSVSSSSDYRSFYNDETAKIVADWYAEDIDYFGFEFEGGARQNTHFS